MTFAFFFISATSSATGFPLGFTSKTSPFSITMASRESWSFLLLHRAGRDIRPCASTFLIPAKRDSPTQHEFPRYLVISQKTSITTYSLPQIGVTGKLNNQLFPPAITIVPSRHVPWRFDAFRACYAKSSVHLYGKSAA